MDKKLGFTLAEVLITLTIIGVIAALTIPNLMQKWSDQADVAKVKEAYSILSNAYKMAVAENGPSDTWNWPNNNNYSGVNYSYATEMFSRYLKVQKLCINDIGGCFDYGWSSSGEELINSRKAYYKSFSNNIATNYGPTDTYFHGRMILSNGMREVVGSSSPTEGNGNIFVDINGIKKPNQYGYDVFWFVYNRNGVFASTSDKSKCSKNQTSQNNGWACSYWILKHGNMDYKYRDVSAEW